jgi:DNA-binding XRE family transcriptional regulator
MQTIEELLNQEYQARADLLEAQETYKNESLAIRMKLGAIFRDKRLSVGFSQQHAAALLGVCRQKVFAIENPDKVLNPFGTETYCEMLNCFAKLVEIMPGFPKVRRGKPLGWKKKPESLIPTP